MASQWHYIATAGGQKTCCCAWYWDFEREEEVLEQGIRLWLWLVVSKQVTLRCGWSVCLSVCLPDWLSVSPSIHLSRRTCLIWRWERRRKVPELIWFLAKFASYRFLFRILGRAKESLITGPVDAKREVQLISVCSGRWWMKLLFVSFWSQVE